MPGFSKHGLAQILSASVALAEWEQTHVVAMTENTKREWDGWIQGIEHVAVQYGIDDKDVHAEARRMNAYRQRLESIRDLQLVVREREESKGEQ